MQSRFAWQEVVLILGMFTAIIVSGIYAPVVVTVLGGCLSTLIGYLAGTRKAGEEEPIPPTKPSATDGGAK